MIFSCGLLASSAYACSPNGWVPVDPAFCDEDGGFVLTPPASPTVEFNSQLGFAVYVLADGSRLTFDLAKGVVTIVMAGGGSAVVHVSQLDAQGQRDFWSIAQMAADGTVASFKLPTDYVVALGLKTPKAGSTTSSDEEMCPDDASGTPVLECVDAQLPPDFRYYYSSFHGGLRAGQIGSIPGGAWVCSLPTRELCANELQRLRNQWEADRDEACSDRNFAIGGAVIGFIATPFSCAAGGVLSAGIVTAPAGIALCATTGAATVLAVLQAVKKDARCSAPWRGP